MFLEKCSRAASAQRGDRSKHQTYIEFADVLEVLVERLDHVVDELEHAQLVDLVVDVQADDKVERGVAPVDDFVLAVVEEGALVFCPGKALANQFSFERDALLHREAIIVFGQTRLPLLVHHQNELDHCSYFHFPASETLIANFKISNCRQVHAVGVDRHLPSCLHCREESQ